MATAKIILFKSKTLQSKKHPVMLRITKGGKRKYISLGYYAKETQWHASAAQFNNKYEEKDKDKRDDHNLILANYKRIALKLLDDFKKEHKDFTLLEFEKRFNGTVKKTTVGSFFDEKITSLEKANKIGYADVFRYTKSAIDRFKKSDSLMFSDIDHLFLDKFENFLISENNNSNSKKDSKKGSTISGNSISVYMRTFRTLYNDAIKEGYAKPEQYPFKNNFNPNGYNISKVEQKTSKRAISKDHIEKIKNSETDLPTFIHAKNFFMFSFYTMGMNFTDMAFLKRTDIHDGRIIYNRAKNKRLYSIKILPPAQDIIDYYSGLKGPYLFPIINDEIHKTPQQKKTRIKTALKKFNSDLKKIAENLGIHVNLSSYVARHSWATILKKMGYSTAIISEGLGHQDEKTTQIYLDSFGNDTLDDVNKNIL